MEREENLNNNYISLLDASKLCSYSQEYLSLRARQGKLRASKLGRNWVTTKEWLEEYLKKTETFKTDQTIKKEVGFQKKENEAVKEYFKKAESLPPDNLPVGTFDESIQDLLKTKLEKRAPALRFGFTYALVFVLLVGGMFLGTPAFKDVFSQIDYRYENLESKLRGTTYFLVFSDKVLDPTKTFIEDFGSELSRTANLIFEPFRSAYKNISWLLNFGKTEKDFVKKEELDSLRQEIERIEREGVVSKEVEVSRIVRVEPIKEITRQIIRVDGADLADVRNQIAQMATWGQDILNLRQSVRSVVSFAPAGVPAASMNVGGSLYADANGIQINGSGAFSAGISALSGNFTNNVFSGRFFIDDGNTILDSDIAGNMIFTDAVSGTVTLAALIGGGGGGLGANLASLTNDILSDNGIIILGGRLGVNNENLTFDFETVADTVGINTGTGVTTLDFNALDITTTGNITAGGWIVGGNIEMADDNWIGLGGAKGRMVFDDTPVTDELQITAANLTFPADNSKVIFGTGADASIYYDGTNLVVDPREVGAGGLAVGVGAIGVDYDLIFDGETNDLTLTWLEDEASLKGTGGLWLDGTTGTTPTSGNGTRFMWIPAKAALRAGIADEIGVWDDANIGLRSIGLGRSAQAKGDHSIAIGESNLASGEAAVVLGYDSTASGNYSTAYGIGNAATGGASTAFGQYTAAGGLYSTSFGTLTAASGRSSIAGVESSVASGDYSVALGLSATASGAGSVAIGEQTTATGNYSIALGQLSTALSNNSFAWGVGAFAGAANNFTVGDGLITSTANSVNLGVQTTWLEITDGLAKFIGDRVIVDPTTAYVDDGTTALQVAGDIFITGNINSDGSTFYTDGAGTLDLENLDVNNGGGITMNGGGSITMNGGDIYSVSYITPNVDTVTIGFGAAIDYILAFWGDTNTGILTWMEDEDYFAFSDDILMNSTERIYFRDTAISITSLDDGHLDITADVAIDLNGNVNISGTISPGNIIMADDGWIGLGVAKGRIVFDDTPATDEIQINNANLTLGAGNVTTTGTGTFGDAVIGGVGIAWNAGDSILYFDNNIGITGGGSFILDTANNWYWEGGTGELITQKGSFQEFSTAGGNIYDFWDGFNYYLYTPNLYVTGGGGIELDGGSISFDSIGGGDLYYLSYINSIGGGILDMTTDPWALDVGLSLPVLDITTGGYISFQPSGTTISDDGSGGFVFTGAYLSNGLSNLLDLASSIHYGASFLDVGTGTYGIDLNSAGSVQITGSDLNLASAFIHDTINGFVQVYGQENAGATGLRVYNTDGFIMFQVDTLGDAYTRRNFTIGAGVAATDYTLTFNGETNDGVITWMEDEDYFKFDDSILMSTAEPVYFRDTNTSIYSSGASYLDLAASGYIFLRGTTRMVGNNRLEFRENAERIESSGANILDLYAGTTFNFYIGSTAQINLTDGKLAPTTNNDIDLGDDTHRFKDLYLVGATIHMGTSGDEGTLTYTTATNTWDFTNNISTAGSITVGTPGTQSLNVNGDIFLNSGAVFFWDSTASFFSTGGNPLQGGVIGAGTIAADASGSSTGFLTIGDALFDFSAGVNVSGYDFTVNTSQGYFNGTDSWTLPIQYTDFIYSYSNAWIAFDLQSQINYISVEQNMRFNYKNMLFAEGQDADIYVEASTGYAYEGGDMTLRAGDGLLGGGAWNATGGTLWLKGGTSSGATEGAVHIYGSIAEDVFETDIENTQVPFVSYAGGIANQALPLYLAKGTGTAYKNQMVAYTYNGSAYTSRTSESRTAFGTAFTLLADTNDYVYVGLQSHPFTSAYFDLGTNGSGLTLLVEYWNGSDWIDLDGMSGPPLLADTTNNFSNSGYISVDHSGMLDWTANAVSGTTAYWIRISTSAVTIAPTCYKTGTNYFATPIFRAYTDTSTVSYYSAWNGYNGIYTATPAAMLHVNAPNIAGIETLRLSTLGTTGDPLMRLYSSTSSYGDIWFDKGTNDFYIDNAYNNTAGEIYFRTKTLGTAVNNLILKDTTVTFGTNADTDITVNFTGTTNSGQFLWMEDEDYFKFSDDILMNSTENIYLRDTAISINSADDGHLDLTADVSIDFNAPEVIFPYGVGAPTLTTNGSLSIAYVDPNHRIYFYSNGGLHYVNETAGFEIPNFETTDPLSGEEIKEGDFVMGMINYTVSDGALHGLWVKWDSVKKDLIEEIKNSLIIQLSAQSDGSTQGGEAVQEDTSLIDALVALIKNTLADIGLLIENGIVQAKELISDKITSNRITVKTARVNKMEIVDSETGEIYCTWIKNGEWVKVKGDCETAGQLTEPQIDPPAEPPIDPPVDPGVTEPPVSDSEPEPEPDSDPEPAPEPDPEPNPEPSPEPVPEPTPEPVPELSPVPEPAPEPAPEPPPAPEPVSASVPAPAAETNSAPAP